jgi:hypothetical protein
MPSLARVVKSSRIGWRCASAQADWAGKNRGFMGIKWVCFCAFGAAAPMVRGPESRAKVPLWVVTMFASQPTRTSRRPISPEPRGRQKIGGVAGKNPALSRIKWLCFVTFRFPPYVHSNARDIHRMWMSLALPIIRLPIERGKMPAGKAAARRRIPISAEEEVPCLHHR